MFACILSVVASKSYYNYASPFYQRYPVRQYPVQRYAYTPYTQQSYYTPYTQQSRYTPYKTLADAPIATPDVNPQMATAALAYMKAIKSDDSCASVAQVYLTTLINGGDANEAAAQKYQALYRTPGFTSSAACKAAETAYLNAVSAGQEPVSAAATAYIGNSAAARNDDPCGQAGQAYFNLAAAGGSQTDALNAATKGFMSAWNILEAQGKSVFDGACGEAVNAYIKSL